uniref:Putative lipocalin n=1 Tax=Ixodes ricinus TaxID=34613 RepID=V5I388_IXORI
MTALKLLVFCLSVSAAYAVRRVFQKLGRGPPDNNPDLNRKDLGPMLGMPWKYNSSLRSNHSYFSHPIAVGWGTQKHYKNVRCLQVRSSDLNHTLKSANYTSKWYNTTSKRMESSTQYVQAVKQKEYSIENIMHLGQPQREVTSPNGTCYNLDFNFVCESGGCRIHHQECWQKR